MVSLVILTLVYYCDSFRKVCTKIQEQQSQRIADYKCLAEKPPKQLVE